MSAEIIFQKIFLNLLNDLIRVYPEYPEFSTYYTLAKMCPSSMWKSSILDFKKYSEPYQTKIKERDETFFTDEQFLKDLLEKLELSQDSFIVNEMEKIRGLYFLDKTTPKTKELLWQYISQLTDLCGYIN